MRVNTQYTCMNVANKMVKKYMLMSKYAQPLNAIGITKQQLMPLDS